MAPCTSRKFRSIVDLTSNNEEKCLICGKFTVYNNGKCIACDIITKVNEIRNCKRNDIPYAGSTSFCNHSRVTEIEVKYKRCYCKKRPTKGIRCLKCKTVFHYSCVKFEPKQKIWLCSQCVDEDLMLKLRNLNSRTEIISVLANELLALKKKCEAKLH